MAVMLADEQDVSVDTTRLLQLGRFVLAEEDVPEIMDVTILLVDEATIAQLNTQHLGAEGPTDVLAFPIDDPADLIEGAPAILGDVVLCPDYIARQATEHGRSAEQELAMLTVHGLLHLLGLDHADPDEARHMFGRTDELLAAFRQVTGDSPT